MCWMSKNGRFSFRFYCDVLAYCIVYKKKPTSSLYKFPEKLIALKYNLNSGFMHIGAHGRHYEENVLGINLLFFSYFYTKFSKSKLIGFTVFILLYNVYIIIKTLNKLT